MAISADLERVFEIGPVFRAENSNTRRHLCEFTGLDLEMAVHSHYNEALFVIHRMFRHIFNGLEVRFKKELEVVRRQYPSEPVSFTEEALIIHWDEGMRLLKEGGHSDIDELGDLSSALELSLGQIVKEKYNADFFILDQYPSAIRPFYTMPNPANPVLSNSYDMFIRGQEICSGAQRCHEAPLLEQRIRYATSPNPYPYNLSPLTEAQSKGERYGPRRSASLLRRLLPPRHISSRGRWYRAGPGGVPLPGTRQRAQGQHVP